MSKQRTYKSVIKILVETYSSLVKLIFDGKNNFMQNKCNKWIKYRNILPNHKNSNMGSSTVHLHGVGLIDMKIYDWLQRRIFILNTMHKN